MINEQIRDREVRLIGSEGEQLGIHSAKDAQKIAREQGLDLVKIAPLAKPPVCKIIDFGKFRYEQTKREKEAKKKQNVVSVKEVRLSPNIEEHDINTKMTQAQKFLTKGDKVKVAVRFRGRELAHTSVGRTILLDFAKQLEELGEIEKQPKMEGKSMTMFLTPKKTK
jgi:translation initiation factor IF-3